MPSLLPFDIVRPEGHVSITLEAFEEDGRLVCGVFALRGEILLPPKAWVRAVRAELKRIEIIAARAGCEEIRIAGRDWRRVLSDYEPCAGLPNGLRKVLRKHGLQHAEVDQHQRSQ